MAVATFRADVVFRFESESLETAGQQLRKLQLAARDPVCPDRPGVNPAADAGFARVRLRTLDARTARVRRGAEAFAKAERRPAVLFAAGSLLPADYETSQPRYSRACVVSSMKAFASSREAKTYGPGRIGSTRIVPTG
jgi:hypothetical protein